MEWQIHSVFNIQRAEYSRRFDRASLSLNELFLALFLAENKHGLINDYPTTLCISFKNISAQFLNIHETATIQMVTSQAKQQMRQALAKSIHRNIEFDYGIEYLKNEKRYAVFFEITLVKNQLRKTYNDFNVLVDWGERYIIHRLFRAIPTPPPMIEHLVAQVPPPGVVYSMFKKLFG